MKLLIIAPQNAYPPADGGKIGIYFPLIEFARWATVHYAFTTDELPDVNCKKKLENQGVQLHPFVLTTKDSPLVLIKNIFFSIPFKFQKYYSSAFLQYLNLLVCRENITHVWINHAHMASYALALRKKHTVKIYLREHNIEFSLVQQLIPFLKSILKRKIAYWQFRKTLRYEVNAWRAFDKVVFISDADYATARQYYDGTNTTLIYDSYEKDSIKPITNATKFEPDSFIYTGSLHTLQNAINLKTFVNNIWTRFSKENPSYKLYITGNSAETVEKHLGINLSDHQIDVLGFVPDINEAIASKQFFLSPTYIGSGVRIKVLNAMASGAVCFITPMDEAMLDDIVDEKNCFVFSDYCSFTDKLVLARNPEKYKAVSKQASMLMQQEKYSWQYYGEAVKQLMQ